MLDKGILKLVDVATELKYAVSETVDFMFGDCEEIGSSDMYACYTAVLRQVEICPSELGRVSQGLVYTKINEAIYLLERNKRWDQERLERCK